MQLVRPSVKYKQQFLESIKEKDDMRGDTCLVGPTQKQSFEDFINQYADREQGINLLPGYVPETMFWLIDNDEFIGRVSIRHELTEKLKQVGGHIGYYIRPSKRNMGYGKKILELGLQEAKKIGLPKALVTCDEDNIGSRKIIEANGGVLENIIEVEKDKPKTRRYWITLQS